MYKVNKVKLCFHVDIHIYIKYSTLKMHLNYIVIMQKLNKN